MIDDLIVLLALALRDGQWLLAGTLAVVGAVWLLRQFGGTYWPWLRSRRGGAVLALVGGQAAALAEALIAGNTGLEALVRGLVAAFLASGGWSLVRAILRAAEPDLQLMRSACDDAADRMGELREDIGELRKELDTERARAEMAESETAGLREEVDRLRLTDKAPRA